MMQGEYRTGGRQNTCRDLAEYWTGSRQNIGQELVRTLDRKPAEFWTGSRQNIGQEAGRVWTKCRQNIRQKSAEYSPGKPPNIGQEAGKILDKKSVEHCAGNRQNWTKVSREGCQNITITRITRELNEDCNSTLFGVQNTDFLGMYSSFDFKFITKISILRNFRKGDKSMLSMKLEFCENFRCLPW